jgi:alpha-glucosidase (family GH31 glycosyl hydrolase)
LVAPILDEGSTKREVYLPAGVWIDFWTDAVYTGPCSLTVEAPLDTLPLFIWQGAILPLGPEMQYSWERSLDPLTLEIYRGADHAYTLYEDDGETTAYQTGSSVSTLFQMTESVEGLLFTIGEAQGGFAGYQSERMYSLKVHQQPGVREVTCNGALLPTFDARQDFDLAASGWWWEKAKGVLTITLARTAKAQTIHIS